MLTCFLLVATALRSATIIISKRHEKTLKMSGAIEYGSETSADLAAIHLLYYASAPFEGLLRHSTVSSVSMVGFACYGLGMSVILCVMIGLGRLWTVKLLLAPDHVLNTHWVFKTVRHPNYYLGIVPELVGYALAFGAYATLTIGLASYVRPLRSRIREEDAVMRERFPKYLA